MSGKLDNQPTTAIADVDKDNFLLVLCNTIDEYNNFVVSAGLNRNRTKPIYRYEDVLGYNEPTKYVALSLPRRSREIREYFLMHNITDARGSK